MTERKDSTNNTGADVEKHETVVDVGKHETVGGHDGDEAMAAFQDGQAVDVDEDTNRRLLRKIYRYILPIICAVYCMNYLDETSLSYANIMGLNEDIHLVEDNYQWSVSLFYFGYLVWEWPTDICCRDCQLPNTLGSVLSTGL